MTSALSNEVDGYSGGGSSDHKVVFSPSGTTGLAPDGATVLEAARSLGVDLDSVCGGRALCGKCQVAPSVGSFPLWDIEATPAGLSSFSEAEDQYKDRRGLGDSRRLGCKARIVGDVVLEVPPESQLHRPVFRKALGDADVASLTLDPLIRLHWVSLPPPDAAGEDSTITARLSVALAGETQVTSVAAHLLPLLHDYAGELPGQEPRIFTAAVDTNGHVRALWLGERSVVCGLAIDVGSTTIAAHLLDLTTGDVLASAGQMNPQVRFGDDLMSRVSYVMLNEGGAEQLTAALHEGLGDLIRGLCKEAAIESDQLVDGVLVANSIMHHLALGIDPTPLGQSPFTLATADPVEIPASAIGIDAPNCVVHVGPCISGHLGADAAAAGLASDIARRSVDSTLLVVDVGTNAEILLGAHGHVYAASSPTGPAFEGAQLTCGQRAVPGAVERVSIDRESGRPSIRVIGCDLWSDDPEFAAATSHLSIQGVCGSGVIEAVAELFLTGLVDKAGVLQPRPALPEAPLVADHRTWAYELWDGIFMTQGDIRAIQLAKAALRAGIELLRDRATEDLGLAERLSPDRIELAGAFGNHLDMTAALVVGLVPDADPSNVVSIGNAAAVGAVRALLSGHERSRLETFARQVVRVETALEPKFQDLFVSALGLPHATLATPLLAQHVELPVDAHPIAGDQARAVRRRRRRTALANPATNIASPSTEPQQQ